MIRTSNFCFKHLNKACKSMFNLDYLNRREYVNLHDFSTDLWMNTTGCTLYGAALHVGKVVRPVLLNIRSFTWLWHFNIANITLASDNSHWRMCFTMIISRLLLVGESYSAYDRISVPYLLDFLSIWDNYAIKLVLVLVTYFSWKYFKEHFRGIEWTWFDAS